MSPSPLALDYFFLTLFRLLMFWIMSLFRFRLPLRLLVLRKRVLLWRTSISKEGEDGGRDSFVK